MVGDSPAIRVAGHWMRLEFPRCEDGHLEAMMRSILQPDAWEELQRKREVDFSFSFPKTGRVRCNAHYQRDHLAMACVSSGRKSPTRGSSAFRRP